MAERAGLETYMKAAARRVDAALEEALPSDEQAGDLGKAMRHITLSGGKRFRPALVLMGCRDVGGSEDDALGAALALELIHAYSLVHDDLPCMDDARQRRGRPCVHVLYGEAMGVLAGDGLLTLAFEVLAARTPAAAPVARMVTVLGQAAGWRGMVGGQVADLEAQDTEPDFERVRAIHLGKTAALIEASLRLGALAGGGSTADVERLGKLGRELGLAFQIIDDVLDEMSSSEKLGKDAGADADNGKLTWPAVRGLDQAREDARLMVETALPLAREGLAGDLLEALAMKILNRSH